MLALGFLAALLLISSSFGHESHSGSGFVQYCQTPSRSSSKHGPDFCISATSFENPSTSMQDLLISMQVTRRGDPARGWTAVGLGEGMHGAMMMVVYGDPATGQRPVVSIRSTHDHAPPHLISLEDAGGADFDLRHAAWTHSDELGAAADTARVDLVFSNATRWPGATVDLASTAHPWIWAWNPDQEFDVYAFDAPLEAHGGGSTDFGRFYVDMTQAANAGAAVPPFPPLLPHRGSIGASTDPSALDGTSRLISRERAWRLHGILMALAFLVLSPAGVVALRSSSSRAFPLHWTLQLLAGICLFLGTLTALLLHPQIVHLHQGVGLALCALSVGQAVLGWKHHVTFLRIRQRTWLSKAHIGMGRVILPLGALNLLCGMLLREVLMPWIAAVASLILFEAIGLGIYLRKAATRRKTAESPTRSDGEDFAAFSERGAAFALEDESEDDGNASEKACEREEEKEELVKKHSIEEP